MAWGTLFVILLIVGLLLALVVMRIRTASTASRKPLSTYEQIIVHVVATHRAWYPAHNEGQQPPETVVMSWIDKLRKSGLNEGELMLLVADHKGRNQVLGES
jgi:hypothetical protein